MGGALAFCASASLLGSQFEDLLIAPLDLVFYTYMYVRRVVGLNA
jgi:hypothetical protein